jgi:phage-related protein
MLVNTIIDNLPLILESGLKILMALVDGIVNHIDQIIDAMINIIIRLIEVIADNLPLLIECGIKILVALITGLSKAIPKLIAAIPTIVSAIFKAFGDVDWSNIGKNIIDGLVAGLKAAKDLVVNSLTNIANGAIKAFKKLFGINSPSTLFKGYGYNIDKGLAIGIDDSIDTIDKSMSNLMDAVNIVPEGLDYNLNGISTPSAISRIASSTTNNNSKTVNVNLNIEHFENSKDEDVKQLMSKMAYLAKKEILGNGGVA